MYFCGWSFNMKVFRELNGHVYAATKMLFFFFSLFCNCCQHLHCGETAEASCYYITFFCKCFLTFESNVIQNLSLKIFRTKPGIFVTVFQHTQRQECTLKANPVHMHQLVPGMETGEANTAPRRGETTRLHQIISGLHRLGLT